jgi:heme exporter protein D
MSEWLHMGGYGLYVWGSIGASLLLPLCEYLSCACAAAPRWNS